ncbi:hypothetical protein D047_0844 [Vibrio parahaemolyticus VPTS-2010_2]|nr:hypothetical protein D047_0844 [Vibrio parahaemolyticus VPTS-2010_2]
MIVCKNYRSRISLERYFYHFSRVNTYGIDGSKEGLAVFDELMLTVKWQDGKYFAFVISHLYCQIAFSYLRIVKHIFLLEVLFE